MPGRTTKIPTSPNPNQKTLNNSEEIFRRLKKEVDDATAEAQRAKGALDQLASQLKDEYDCNNIKEATALLEEFEGKAEEAQKKFQRALKEYERKWKGG